MFDLFCVFLWSSHRDRYCPVYVCVCLNNEPNQQEYQATVRTKIETKKTHQQSRKSKKGNTIANKTIIPELGDISGRQKSILYTYTADKIWKRAARRETCCEWEWNVNERQKKTLLVYNLSVRACAFGFNYKLDQGRGEQNEQNYDRYSS